MTSETFLAMCPLVFGADATVEAQIWMRMVCWQTFVPISVSMLSAEPLEMSSLSLGLLPLSAIAAAA